MRWFSPVLIVLGTLIAAEAGEIQKASVEHRDGEYLVDISVRISGDKDKIYSIATDYQQMSRLSKLIIESGLINLVNANGTSVVRRRIVTRACVIKFCFDATLVEDLWEPTSGTIRTLFVPEESDFEYGEAEWRISRIDKNNTMVDFHSQFRPTFWIPPLIGPYFIKRLMLGAAEETIMNMEKLAAGEEPRS